MAVSVEVSFKAQGNKHLFTEINLIRCFQTFSSNGTVVLFSHNFFLVQPRTQIFSRSLKDLRKKLFQDLLKILHKLFSSKNIHKVFRKNSANIFLKIKSCYLNIRKILKKRFGSLEIAKILVFSKKIIFLISQVIK